MKLYTAYRAPYPRRVLMFMAEKEIKDIELVNVNLLEGEHNKAPFRKRNPVGKIPVLELDDGRHLSESRAICSYLEGLYPNPNLLGKNFEEHAFIEMQDRRIEWYWMVPIISWIRNSIPNLQSLVDHQFKDYAEQQKYLVYESAKWLDTLLSTQPWIAGERFTVADITAFCALEVARVMHFHADEHGFNVLQAWRNKMFERDSAKIQ